MMLCVQWYAGNFVCKVLMMVRTGGFILSSNMLVMLSIDRCTHYTSTHRQVQILHIDSIDSIRQ